MRKFYLNVKACYLTWLPFSVIRQRLQITSNLKQIKHPKNLQKQLLIDVSVIIGNDARTGIQRVVRALLAQLLCIAPVGYRVRPVFATRTHGYRYAPAEFGMDMLQADAKRVTMGAVEIGAGDIFLALDLAAHLLPLHRVELARWKKLGAKVHVVVYDLLPILHPEWFNPKTSRHFRRWIKTIAVYADSIICISNTVKADIQTWLSQQYGFSSDIIPINIIPLGADLQSSLPSTGMPVNGVDLMAQLATAPFVLMVGTLEPRKGHDQIVAAFDVLWQQGSDARLVIVGKAGWKTDVLQQQLRSHAHINTKLFWLNDVSDEFLSKLYSACSGVLLGSRAEGFGLPLIEAMHYHKPVLARNIPVFREVGQDNICFFSDRDQVIFMRDLISWLSMIHDAVIIKHYAMPTWRESVESLLTHLGITTCQLSHMEKVSV